MSLSVWLLGYELEYLAFESRQGKRLFCSPKTSRPALEPTQPPFSMDTGVLSLRINENERGGAHPASCSVPKLSMC